MLDGFKVLLATILIAAGLVVGINFLRNEPVAEFPNGVVLNTPRVVRFIDSEFGVLCYVTSAGIECLSSPENRIKPPRSAKR